MLTLDTSPKPSPYERPYVINGKIDGQDAYFTNDLLEPHPTLPEYWKVYGRSDDQIMHNTGEKVCYISFLS